MQTIKLNNITIGGSALFFIMGPCVIEDEASCLAAAERLAGITDGLGAQFVFKASYDKANRTSANSFRGPGLKEGLRILKKVKGAFNVPILTDVHCRHDVAAVAEVCDIIQIPAYLCRQTDLIVEAAKSGRVVNIKKGQFLSPQDMRNSVEKASAAGCKGVFITERGTTFGYNNLVVDFRGLPVMRETGTPVVFDATHSVQTPGGMGGCSGGDRRMARYLAGAAAAVGIDGVFMEVHAEPDKALCDGPNSIAIDDVKAVIEEITAIDKAVRQARAS
ncbi:MAG: 3-deoxy-8-phosphooctulonate synthase [Deltaproteobacteria bacterium]|nr:3-deoxy-8-phosphooctulonate synthase [Deltaproteobacteria bacterium]